MKKSTKTTIKLVAVIGFASLLAAGVWAGEATPSPVPVSKQTTVVSLATVHPGTSTKGELTVSEVAQKVEDAQDSAKDVQMDLNMETKDSLSGTSQTTKGKIKIKSPDLVYVHYTQPFEQFLYMAGNLAQMYQPSQKMVYQQHGGGGKDAAPVYVGVGKELKRYIGISRVSIIKNTDSEIGLLFIPLKEDSGFDKMRVYIHKKDWWPYQMEMETPSATTKVSFSNFSFNKGLADSLFQFTAPKGTQVVEGAIF